MPPPAKPRLVALDLDGTILDSTGALPGCISDALANLHRAGVNLAFLTGRRPLTARPKIDLLGLPAYVATNSGCLLWEVPGWRQIRRQMFPAQLVRPMADLLEPYSASFYTDSSDVGFEFFYLDRQPSAELELYMQRYGRNSRRISTATEMEGYEVTQVAMPGPAEIVEGFKHQIDQLYGDELFAISVRWPLLPTQALEVFHPQANKGGALAHFAGLLGVDQQDCLAAGDDTNDIPMLRWAGRGVAMPTAQAEVRLAADEVLSGDDPQQALADFLNGLV